MLWFKSRYVIFLEEERQRLLKEITALKTYNEQLVERLLQKNGVPPVGTQQDLQKLLQTTDIFEDIEEHDNHNHVGVDEIVDNRKEEKLDDFTS